MIVRQARSNDIDDITKIISTAFLISDYYGLRNNIIDNPRYNFKDIIVVEENKEVIACTKIIPLKVSFKEKTVNAGGISAVAVLPEYRRRGVADIMLKDALTRMYSVKYPFSLLYPFQHKFYRKYQWEFVGSAILYEIDPSNIPVFDERFNVRKLRDGEREKVKKVYADKIRSINFAVHRNDAFWNRVIFPNVPNCYVYDDGEIRGYIIFEMKKDTRGNVEIEIKELIALSQQAYRGLWGFLASLREQISKIKYLAPADEPVWGILNEPREPNFRRPFFEYKTLGYFCSGFMLRIVHLEEALKLITTADAPNGSTTLSISDNFIPQNNLTFKIEVENRQVSITKIKSSTASIETDIGTFAQIISGFARPSQLHLSGRIKSDANSLKFIDAVFSTSLPFIFQFDIF